MKGILQITLINALNPFYPEIIYPYDNQFPFQDGQFDLTMESVRKGETKELKAFPVEHCTKFRQEFLDDILIDGYPDKEKMNIPLTSKSGIQYFVVNGTCSPDQATINEEIKTYKQNENNTENQEKAHPCIRRSDGKRM